MIRILAVLICAAAAMPAFAQGIFPGGPNARPAFLLPSQTGDLALRPGERRSGLSLLERGQMIAATRGRIPEIVLETAHNPSGTTWTVSARLPQTC